jgi:GNAT superfamily N-acetyltransferase
MQIRLATHEDVPEMLSIIRELAEYEKEPHAVQATEQDLLRDGFGPEARFHALMAEKDGQIAGMALYFYNWSTWKGRAGIHLEDLFVRPVFRGCGIGKALLSAVAAVAVREGCARLQWDVLDWNQPAIDFYQGLGAKILDQWRIMRVSDEALPALAASSAERQL